MDGTKIQWTDATWNPVTGCTKVSPGCTNCYIERTPPFRIQGRKFEYRDKSVTTGVTLHPKRLDQPLRWTRPRKIFVNSLSDLFHEDIPDKFIYDVFKVMDRCRQHTFQILTKRPERMADFFDEHLDGLVYDDCLMPWPLPNVWLGVSTENQFWADRRIPLLAQIPAAVRFISAEPLLGPIDLTGLMFRCGCGTLMPEDCTCKGLALQWVIVGGESGPGARPMQLEWARDIVAQCQKVDLPVFVKQLGSVPIEEQPDPSLKGPAYLNAQHELDMLWPDGTRFGNPTGKHELNGMVVLLKDKKGGDLTEWPDDLKVREFPNV